MNKKKSRDGFKSNLGTILAMAGSAVGLGNIWRFPYVVGENGGAAFILMYLLIIVIICIPAFLAEFAIGRNTQSNVIGAFKKLSPNTQWYHVGTLGLLSCTLMAGFYAVISGWTIAFLYKSITNQFESLNGEQIIAQFDNFVNSPVESIFWVVVFIVITIVILIFGISKGIERYNKILMPSLIIIMIVMVFNSFTLPNYKDGFNFLFNPDFSKLNWNVFLNALGQAFFSMSLGMGTIITYGSYARKKDNAFKISIFTATTDILIAMLAGMIIFPAVFSFNIPAEAGSELAFIAFPTIFQSMPGGYYFSILFFGLLSIAAITSLISIYEVLIAYLVEQFKLKRLLASLIVGLFGVLISSVCALSLIDGSLLMIGDRTVFDFFDYVTASYLLPFSGFLVVIYVGWFWSKKANRMELSSDGTYKLWYFKAYIILLKYIIPVVILSILLSQLGILG